MQQNNSSKLLANVLIIILLISNAFFAYQYVSILRFQGKQSVEEKTKAEERIRVARLNKFLMDTLFNSKSGISYDDRVKLENDIRQTHDEELVKLWNAYVDSKDAKASQENAMKLMNALATRML